MIDKLRELYNGWMEEQKKDVGKPIYAYEIYEFLDYCECKLEEEEE